MLKKNLSNSDQMIPTENSVTKDSASSTFNDELIEDNIQYFQSAPGTDLIDRGYSEVYNNKSRDFASITFNVGALIEDNIHYIQSAPGTDLIDRGYSEFYNNKSRDSASSTFNVGALIKENIQYF